MKPTNRSWLSPYLAVQDVRQAVEFYQKTFGFEVIDVVEKEGVAVHAEMSYKSSTIMIGIQNQDCWKAESPSLTNTISPVLLYLHVDELDKFYEDAIKKGAKSVFAPKNEPWGERVCRLRDPNGYDWSFVYYSA